MTVNKTDKLKKRSCFGGGGRGFNPDFYTSGEKDKPVYVKGYDRKDMKLCMYQECKGDDSVLYAMRYPGRSMDRELLNEHPSEFTRGYSSEESGFLCPRGRGLKNIYSGDWLVFRREGSWMRLINVTGNRDFMKRYKKMSCAATQDN